MRRQFPPNIPGFEIIIPLRSGKQYKSKNAAVTEMKERIWKTLVEKGHRENDEPGEMGHPRRIGAFIE